MRVISVKVLVRGDNDHEIMADLRRELEESMASSPTIIDFKIDPDFKSVATPVRVSIQEGTYSRGEAFPTINAPSA